MLQLLENLGLRNAPKKLCCSEANLPINDSRPPSYHRLPAHCRVGLLAQRSFMTHLFQLQQFKMAHLNSGTFFSARPETNCLFLTARDDAVLLLLCGWIHCAWTNELQPCAHKDDSAHFSQIHQAALTINIIWNRHRRFSLFSAGHCFL